MEIDTCSAVTLVNATFFSKLGGHIETLKGPTVILKSYTDIIIKCLVSSNLSSNPQLDSLLG